MLTHVQEFSAYFATLLERGLEVHKNLGGNRVRTADLIKYSMPYDIVFNNTTGRAGSVGLPLLRADEQKSSELCITSFVFFLFCFSLFLSLHCLSY